MKHSVHDTTLRVHFEGDLLSTNVAALREELLEIIDRYPDALGIEADIAAAKVVDSQGLNLLVALLKECERRHISFRVLNASAEVRRLLTLLKLSARFGVEPVALP